MKKILFSLLNVIALVTLGQAQCSFENIFPVGHRISKFKATTTIASLKNIKENTEANNFSGNFNTWDKPSYLKGDSVFKSSIPVVADVPSVTHRPQVCENSLFRILSLSHICDA